MSTAPDTPPLPPLQDTLLDPGTLEQLQEDLQALAEVEEVLLKGGTEAMAAGRSVPLAEAMAALKQGRVFGVQVRYRYRGQQWWDTLMRTAQGIRLVRIEHRPEELMR